MRSAICRCVLGLTMMLLLPAWAGAAPAGRPQAATSSPTIAFTRNYNVYLMNVDGTNVRTVTTRGSSASTGIQYPRYQWSPDGKYLLLERGHHYGSTNDLLLMGADGALLRTLATGLPYADFPPTWADDSDQIAYVAAARALRGSAQYQMQYDVDAVDVLHGTTRKLFSFSNNGGCGGGTTDPADQILWSETGLSNIEPRMQWNSGTHTMIYSWACGGGLRIINYQSGHTTQYDTAKEQWAEGTLSRTGVLAATMGSIVSGQDNRPYIAITAPGATTVRKIAPGILPTWSADGRYLYFEQRTPGRAITLLKQPSFQITSNDYTSAIWRVDADGTHLTRIAAQDAYAFGPLQATADGKFLIFSRIDNDTQLARYLQTAGIQDITPTLEQRYGPHLVVARLDLTTLAIATIAQNAGRPAVQPAVAVSPTQSPTPTPAAHGVTPIVPVNSPTAVIVFRPKGANGTMLSGACPTHSLAVTRATSWRCLVGDKVLDPCFSQPGDASSVICVSSPFGDGRGPELKLTTPLPAQQSVPGGVHAWAFTLEDGTACSFLQGATAVFTGTRIEYACTNGAYILGEAQPSATWTATEVQLAADHRTITGRQQVALQTVWI